MKETRKKWNLLIWSVGFLLLSACAKAPESSSVSRKNSAKLVEAVTEDSEEGRFLLSELLNTGNDSPEAETVDAEDDFKETEGSETDEADTAESNQKQATAIYNFSFQGEKTYEYKGTILPSQKQTNGSWNCGKRLHRLKTGTETMARLPTWQQAIKRKEERQAS